MTYDPCPNWREGGRLVIPDGLPDALYGRCNCPDCLGVIRRELGAWRYWVWRTVDVLTYYSLVAVVTAPRRLHGIVHSAIYLPCVAGAWVLNRVVRP